MCAFIFFRESLGSQEINSGEVKCWDARDLRQVRKKKMSDLDRYPKKLPNLAPGDQHQEPCTNSHPCLLPQKMPRRRMHILLYFYFKNFKKRIVTPAPASRELDMDAQTHCDHALSSPLSLYIHPDMTNALQKMRSRKETQNLQPGRRERERDRQTDRHKKYKIENQQIRFLQKC